MFKKVLFILALIIFVSSGCSQKEQNNDLHQSIIQKDRIVVGTSYDSKPFAYKDKDGQMKGVEIDLAKEIAKRLLGNGEKVVFKELALQDRIKAAESNEVDMVISVMTINRERKKSVAFSIPYFTAGQVICVRKDKKIDSIYDLINKRVIVILGTTGEQNIKRFAPNALIQGYIDNTEALQAFKDNLGDAIITDDTILLGFVMENPDYKILPKRLNKEPYGIAFHKSKTTDNLREKVNEILKGMKTDGTLREIKYKWGVF